MGLNADFTAPPPSHTLLAVQAAPSQPRGGVTHLTRLLQNYLMFQCQDCLHKCLLTLLIPSFILVFPISHHLQSPLAAYNLNEIGFILASFQWVATQTCFPPPRRPGWAPSSRLLPPQGRPPPLPARRGAHRRAGFHGLVPGALLAGADSRREPFCCGLFEQDLPLPGPPPTALGLRPGASRG